MQISESRSASVFRVIHTYAFWFQKNTTLLHSFIAGVEREHVWRWFSSNECTHLDTVYPFMHSLWDPLDRLVRVSANRNPNPNPNPNLIKKSNENLSGGGFGVMHTLRWRILFCIPFGTPGTSNRKVKPNLSLPLKI